MKNIDKLVNELVLNDDIKVKEEMFLIGKMSSTFSIVRQIQ